MRTWASKIATCGTGIHTSIREIAVCLENISAEKGSARRLSAAGVNLSVLSADVQEVGASILKLFTDFPDAADKNNQDKKYYNQDFWVRMEHAQKRMSTLESLFSDFVTQHGEEALNQYFADNQIPAGLVLEMMRCGESLSPAL